MAYLVYIVRQNDYNNPEEESNISFKEWMGYINTDPELEPAEGLQLNMPILLKATDIPFSSEERLGYCEWMGHPRADTDTIPWFEFQYSSIVTEYPDKHTIGKMIKIAAVLNARVRGDDGEYYDETFFTNGGCPVQE